MFKLKDTLIVDIDIIKTDKAELDYYEDITHYTKQTEILFIFEYGNKVVFTLENECASYLTFGDLFNYLTSVDFSTLTKEEFIRLFKEDVKKLFYVGIAKENQEYYKYYSVEFYVEYSNKYIYTLSQNKITMQIKGNKRDLDTIKQFIEDNINCDSYNINWRNRKFTIELNFNSLECLEYFYSKKNELKKKIDLVLI